jgi:hypothetical protein
MNSFKILIFLVAHFWLIGSLALVSGKQNLAVLSLLIFPIVCFVAGLILELMAFLPKGEGLLSSEMKIKAIRNGSEIAKVILGIYVVGVIFGGAIFYFRGNLPLLSWLYWSLAGFVGISVYFLALHRFIRRI